MKKLIDKIKGFTNEHIESVKELYKKYITDNELKLTSVVNLSWDKKNGWRLELLAVETNATELRSLLGIFYDKKYFYIELGYFIIKIYDRAKNKSE